MTLHVIRVVNTAQCHMIYRLVWCGHFIFTAYRTVAEWLIDTITL